MVIAAFAGVGKTYFGNHVDGAKDFVCMPYKYGGLSLLPQGDSSCAEGERAKANPNYELNPEYPHNYVRAILENSDKYKYLLIPPDWLVLAELACRDIPYILCYPEAGAKETYRKRYIERGNTSDFLDIFIGGWDSFMEFLRKDRHGIHIVLTETEYLTDAKPLIDAIMSDRPGETGALCAYSISTYEKRMMAQKLSILGEKYYVEHNFSKALSCYHQAAEASDRYAQYNLALMYEVGEGTAVDHAKAVYWYRKSAEAGFPEAQINLALCYHWGTGVEKSEKAAYDLLVLAEKSGHPNAQYWLGKFYYTGTFVKSSDEKSAQYFRNAAEQGHADAQDMLGLLYYNGEGVTQNFSESAYWFEKAAKQGVSHAQVWLGCILESGQNGEANPEKARAWYRKAAEQGVAEAQDALGVCLCSSGEKAQYETGLFWLKKAAGQGYSEAQYHLAAYRKKK